MKTTKKLLAVAVITVFVYGALSAQTPPKDPKAETLRAQAAEYLGKDNDKAIDLLNQALKIDPNYGRAYSNRGLAYYSKGDYDRAIADYNQAIKVDPTYSVAYGNRGNAYFRKDNYDQAIADCSKAISLDPEYAFAYVTRAASYWDGKKDYAKAVADATQAAKLNPRYNEVVSKFLAGIYDASKFTVIPSNFEPQNYTKLDLFDAVAKIENPASASELASNKDALANALSQAFGAAVGVPVQYVSDLVLISQSGTAINFETADRAISKKFTINSRSGLTAGQKARVYYSVQINNNYPTLSVWTVDAIEKL